MGEATQPKKRWYKVTVECEDGTRFETQVETENPSRAVVSFMRRTEKSIGSREAITVKAVPS